MPSHGCLRTNDSCRVWHYNSGMGWRAWPFWLASRGTRRSSAFLGSQPLSNNIPFHNMSTSLLLNIIAIAISTAALCVSILIAIRQITIMRQSNQMPIFINLEQEFRSERFQRAELYVLRKLKDKDAVKGVQALPDEARLAVTLMSSYFGVLGSLVIYGIVSERQAVAALGYRADQLWRKLEPFILAERRIRGDDDHAKFFEDFICRVRAHWPPEKSYSIPVRRLGDLGGRI